MKNLILFSMLAVGLMLTSCSAIQIVTEPGTETPRTPTKSGPTKKTNKVVMKPKNKQPDTQSRESNVIKKPVAKKPSSKKGKVVKKPTQKPSNQSMTTKPTTKASTTKAHQTKQKVLMKPAAPKKVKKKTKSRVEIKKAPQKSSAKVGMRKPMKKVVKKKEKVAKIALDEPRYNFGTINEGTIIKRDFRFTNVGEADLLIEIATGSCGCTVPEWPIKAIKPGQSDVIHVTFDSTDKEYDTRVEVNIVANTEPIVTEIIMTGRVIPKRDFKKKKEH